MSVRNLLRKLSPKETVLHITLGGLWLFVALVRERLSMLLSESCVKSTTGAATLVMRGALT